MVAAFDALIAYSAHEPKRKLFFLLQYNIGPAHALVKRCQHMPNNLAYAQARELLQKTFGQKFQNAKTCIDSVTKGSVLQANDKASLIQFSAEVNSCMNTLVGLDHLYKMDNLDVLTKISRPLPISLLNGWETEVDNIIHHKMCDLSICDLANYVSL